MKILAIFTCFNRKELTKRGMATLSENRDVTFDYVILDDNSSDGTREMLKQMRDDGTYQIDLIEGDGSNFWNGGMHKAIEHIKNTHMDYDYYMLMNDDTKFFPGIFDEMAPHLKKDIMLGRQNDSFQTDRLAILIILYRYLALTIGS